MHRILDPRIPAGPESETWPSAFRVLDDMERQSAGPAKALAAIDQRTFEEASVLHPLDAVTGGTCQLTHIDTGKSCGKPGAGWFTIDLRDGEARYRACEEHRND